MYLLEGRVIFNPEKGMLSEGGKTVLLNTSASHCLLVLILSEGVPVKGSDMIQRVWRMNGSSASEASVRQAFHLIRKAFAMFSLSEHLIRTTRRQGYSIDISLVRRKRVFHAWAWLKRKPLLCLSLAAIFLTIMWLVSLSAVSGLLH